LIKNWLLMPQKAIKCAVSAFLKNPSNESKNKKNAFILVLLSKFFKKA